jgi:DNA-binding CsgD family transcriptional regulator
MYQTRIVGIDNEWSYPSTSRNLNVVGFSEGKYSIEFRAREDGKLWSDSLRLNLVIEKPWYRTWWAMLLFIGSGLSTILLATKIHNNNLIKQKKNLQKTIDARTQQLNQQNNEIIEQQKRLIQQKEELIAKNEAVYKSQQALVEADMNYMQLKEKQLQDEILYKNKQITTHALNILQKNETLKHLRDQLAEIVKSNHRISIPEIKKTMKTIDDSFRLDKDWEDFKFYFEQIHTGFYSKLNLNYPELTPLELRHCALIRLNLNLIECASILGISNDSIKVSRTRLRKKLSLIPNQSLTEFVMGI